MLAGHKTIYVEAESSGEANSSSIPKGSAGGQDGCPPSHPHLRTGSPFRAAFPMPPALTRSPPSASPSPELDERVAPQ